MPLIFLSEAEGLIFITFFMAFAEKHCQQVNKHFFFFFLQMTEKGGEVQITYLPVLLDTIIRVEQVGYDTYSSMNC